jgi:hypothetical protein
MVVDKQFYYEENAHGMELHNVTQKLIMTKQWIDRLVDDTSIFTNLTYGNNSLI